MVAGGGLVELVEGTGWDVGSGGWGWVGGAG